MPNRIGINTVNFVGIAAAREKTKRRRQKNRNIFFFICSILSGAMIVYFQ